ncbi:FxSxx-COOH system tetratricopeptide repeat protein [Actinoplanes sp. NPDC023714]|uniref:FxSxx-COOH system tetratricopeptide repeat protein n=1 Tax=Actinoplanes sp. NPDC023714 TaxID=3154322 RepID=UPI00340091F6
MGTVPVVVAAGGWLTNVLTSGWNPWLFAALAGVVVASSALSIAVERGRPSPAAPPRRPEQPAGPPVWLDVPPRSRHFTGREELLALLDRRPGESQGVTALVPHALYGLGGVGKTHLAIEYAHRHQNRFDLVAWIPAEQPASLRTAYLRIAEAMGLPESEDTERTLDLVRDALRRGVPFRRWLIIFDNAEEPSSIQRHLPEAAPPHSTGRVLITSRDRGWSSVGDTIEVEVLERDESVALLRRRNPGVSEADAEQLAGQLGDLPLALEQASAWIDASGTAVPQYLGLLSARTRDLLDANRPTDYPMSVAATWGVALDRLATTDSAAVALLELTAFLGPEPIDRRIFRLSDDVPAMLKAVLDDPLRLDQALTHIGKLSLAKLDPVRGTIQLHRLVQAVVRARVGAERREELRLAAQTLLAAAGEAAGDAADPESWSAHAGITPHLRSAGCLGSGDRRIQELVLRQLTYLFNRGDAESCRDFAEEAWRQWAAKSGPSDVNTLYAAFWVASAARDLGDVPLSKVLLEEVLGRSRRALGNGHPVTLRAANSYGANLRLAGDYRRAYQSDLLNLERCRATYGPDGFWTSAVSNNLAIDLRFLGRFREALALNEEAFALRRRTLGPDHVMTLFSQMACATDLYYLGLYRRSLAIVDSVQSRIEQHGLTPNRYLSPPLRARALILTGIGEHERAAVVSRQLLDRYRTVFGPGHPDTLAMAMTTANALRAGYPRESLALARTTVEHHRRMYGPDHPATIAALVNTAVAERSNDEHAAAARHDEQTAPLVAGVFGDDHWVTLCAAAGRGIDLSIAGEHVASCRLLRQTYDTSVAVRGADHPYTLRVGADLAKALRRAGRPQEARALRTDLETRLSGERDGDPTPMAALHRREWAECPVELPLC